MEHPVRDHGYEPSIKCSFCSRDVPISAMETHDCSSTVSQPLPYQSQPMASYPTPPPMNQELQRPPRPFVPKIDPFAHMNLPGELTPASSQASPISAGSGRRSPMRFPPHRKVSVPNTRRPPSPELLSQDCAFPPFPIANKPKRKDSTTSDTARGRAKTPDGLDSDSVRSFDHHAKRSASVGGSRQRSRHGTNDSKSSNANSSRKPSLNSRSNSRQGSVDDVPPIPPITSAINRNINNSDPDPSTSQTPSSELSYMDYARADLGTEPVIYEEPEPDHSANTQQHETFDASRGPTFDDLITAGTSREPSYKAKRPPPIVRPQPYSMDSATPTTESQESIEQPPRTPGGSLTRTLTSLFSRKRAPSNAQRNGLPDADNSLRRKALAPEDSLSSMPMPSPDALLDDRSAINQMHIVEATPHPQEIIPTIETSTDEWKSDSSGSRSPRNHSMIMQQDFEDALAAVVPSPGLPRIEEYEEDVRRVSIDSASSYGSIGFSHKSTSSRSTAPTDLHPKEPAGNWQSTSEVSFDFGLSISSNPISTDNALDSPTDPFYNQSSMTLVSKPGSRDHSPAESVSMYNVTLPPPPEPQNLHPHRPRRPSTPGTNKGICRGCSQIILGSQKSVSSKDGQLSGRYHKECFVCKTCDSPFATADFYVYDDHPYCAHHYHVINDTLCNSCGKGIEGQYMETSSLGGKEAKKFHIQCLKCTTCKIQLNNDYFELGGMVYCERDAFRMANTPKSPGNTAPSRPSPLNREYISSGEPSRNLTAGRFPERRTTRLMMTY